LYIYIHLGQMTTYYIKFRFDLQENEHPYQILNMLCCGAEYYPGILGVENYNKYGEQIKKHLHYHFVSNVESGTIRHRLERSYPDFKIRGKGWYSLKQEKDIKDTNDFYRYCVKQYEPHKFVYEYARVPCPDNFDLSVQQLLAHEQYQKGKEILGKKKDKDNTRLSVYERIIDKVTNDSPDLKSLVAIKMYILAYFMENELPPNKLKICDMAMGIGLKLKVITPEEFFG